MQKRHRISACRGFTLVELLVVLAIMAVIVSMSLPAAMSLVRGSRLSAADSQITNQLGFARQYAMAKNCQVEVRFYQLPDPNNPTSGPTVYRAFQCFSLSSSTAVATPITKVLFLPDQICIVNNINVSSLLKNGSPPYYVTGTTSGASLGTIPPSSYNYTCFHFKPDGSTDLDPSAVPPWYLSLANQNDSTTGGTVPGLPKNFSTIQIDTLTGRVRSYRPN